MAPIFDVGTGLRPADEGEGQLTDQEAVLELRPAGRFMERTGYGDDDPTIIEPVAEAG